MRRLQVVALLGLLAFRTGAEASSSSLAVQRALLYLEGSQNPDGSWGKPGDLTTRFHTTATVIEAFREIGHTENDTFDRALSFVGGQLPKDSDYLARKVLAHAGGGPSATSDVAVLVSRQNHDGGWGAGAGFGSSVVDTALAVRALHAFGFPVGRLVNRSVLGAGSTEIHTVSVPTGSSELSILITFNTGTIDIRVAEGTIPNLSAPFFRVTGPNVLIRLTPTSPLPLVPGMNHIRIDSVSGATYSAEISIDTPQGDGNVPIRGLKYLFGAQQSGGFGFTAGTSDPKLYFSTLAAEALLGATDVGPTAEFLLMKRNADGGFGDSLISTVFESAIALRYLRAVDAVPEEAPTTVDFLLNTQAGDGGWNDDAFETALAIAALAGEATCVLDVDGTGFADVPTDVVYIARHLLGLASVVPPSFRVIDPTIPPDSAISGAVELAGSAFDVDDDGTVDVPTDVAYIARHLLGFGATVPPSFRAVDPSIPSDAEIQSRIDGLCAEE